MRGGDSTWALETNASLRNHPKYLTTVISEYTIKRCHYRVLFGDPVRRVLVSRSRGSIRVRHEFAAGARFVLDLWRRNAHGTTQWRCCVCEAVAPGEEAVRVPHVVPGARVLLSTQGVAQSKLFLAWVYDLNTQGRDILRCPREEFEAAHFRLKGLVTRGLPHRRLSGVL